MNGVEDINFNIHVLAYCFFDASHVRSDAFMRNAMEIQGFHHFEKQRHKNEHTYLNIPTFCKFTLHGERGLFPDYSLSTKTNPMKAGTVRSPAGTCDDLFHYP